VRYRIKEIKEPFRATIYKVQRRRFGVWCDVYDDNLYAGLPASFATLDGARKCIEELQAGTTVKVHE
jgi:hypothetical protein